MLLQIKSHGNAFLALTTLLSVLRGYESADAALGEQHFEEPELVGYRQLGEFPNGIGVTNPDYLSIITEADRPVELVVMEFCESRLDDDLVSQIPSHAQRLFSVDEPAS